MAKAFKIIMRLILILFIVVICAVFIPPLLGVTTSIATTGMNSNMQTGSVAYGVKESLDELQAGEKIIYTTEDSVYIYEVTDINSETGELTVLASENSESEYIQLKRNASKVIIVVPYIGYIYIATQSFEGLIILALSVALVIILFIIASIIGTNDSYEQDAEEDDASGDFGYFRSLSASASRPSSLDSLSSSPMFEVTDEDIAKTQTFSSNTSPIDEATGEMSELILEKADKTDDIVSEETIQLDGINPEADKQINDKSSQSSEIHESAKQETAAEDSKSTDEREEREVSKEENTSKNNDVISKPEKSVEKTEKDGSYVSASQQKESVAKEVSDIPVDNTDSSEAEISELAGALEHALDTDQMNQPSEVKTVKAPSQEEITEVSTEEEAPHEIELAIPVRTLDDLLQEAYAKGEDPQVKKNDITGVTIVDYSSCF